MHIEINEHNETRFLDALKRRAELLRRGTQDMRNDWSSELNHAEMIIASAVAYSWNTGGRQR
jgi:hypothetical protein